HYVGRIREQWHARGAMPRSASKSEHGSIVEAVESYERWLRRQVKVVEPDLKFKREKIATNAFVFLRGTYFRWSAPIEAACPALSDAPRVLAIGDTHLENFGVWRDAEGRLAWGANDFDEAARMPYPFDLVRLGTSAKLAWHDLHSRSAICDAILAGYRRRLAEPGPFILDEKYAWMRAVAMTNDAECAKFWRDIDKTKKRAKHDAQARF